MSALRKLPVKEALAALGTGEGATTLPPHVRSIVLRYVARNAAAGPREFALRIAPRIAYANPSLSFVVEKLPDPRTKSKDPKDQKAVAGVDWAEGSKKPEPEMVVEFEQGAPRTVDLAGLDASQILAKLSSVATGN